VDEVEAAGRQHVEGPVHLGAHEVDIRARGRGQPLCVAEGVGEKSSPVIRAPSRAREIVSVPM
jgi:hypothetical protein